MAREHLKSQDPGREGRRVQERGILQGLQPCEADPARQSLGPLGVKWGTYEWPKIQVCRPRKKLTWIPRIAIFERRCILKTHHFLASMLDFGGIYPFITGRGGTTLEPSPPDRLIYPFVINPCPQNDSGHKLIEEIVHQLTRWIMLIAHSHCLK